MEETYLETIPEVDSIKSKRSSASVAPSDIRTRAMAPPVQRTQHNEPAWSQPSPTIPQYHFEPSDHNRRDSFNDISPVSTPRKSWGGQSVDDIPVSPLEPVQPIAPRAPLPESKRRSKLPRRVQQERNRPAGPGHNNKEQTKWDPYSGEPNEAGVPASARPGVQPLEQQYPQLKERTKQILAGLREREQLNNPSWARVHSLVTSEPPNYPLQKRSQAVTNGTALRNPFVNDQLPDRTAARVQPQRDTRHHDPPTTLTTLSESPIHTIRTVSSEESIKPVAPLKIRSRNNTPTEIQCSESDRSDHSSASSEPKALQSPFRSPNPPRMFEEPMPLSSTRTDSPQNDPSPPTPRTPPFEQFHEAKTQPTPQSDHEVSRFSWTTYATSVAESPGSGALVVRNDSPPPPMPPMPMIRKRPTSTKYNEDLYANVDSARAHGSIVIRKPIPGRSKAHNTDQKSPLKLSKTLPQLPIEVQAGDKISNFEAQLDALGRKKHNTNRIINSLKENLKKNQVIYDMKKRKEVQSMINEHEKDLQSIVNDEHDINLQMHRAIKKRDQNDNYAQPTGLWIRRVTS